LLSRQKEYSSCVAYVKVAHKQLLKNIIINIDKNLIDEFIGVEKFNASVYTY